MKSKAVANRNRLDNILKILANGYYRDRYFSNSYIYFEYNFKAYSITLDVRKGGATQIRITDTHNFRTVDSGSYPREVFDQIKRECKNK